MTNALLVERPLLAGMVLASSFAVLGTIVFLMRGDPFVSALTDALMIGVIVGVMAPLFGGGAKRLLRRFGDWWHGEDLR